MKYSSLRSAAATFAAAAILSSGVAVCAENDIQVYVDGERLTFDVAPIIENDRTLVPMRAIFEALGADVTWDDSTRTAKAVRGSDVMSITIDNSTMYINDVAVKLDAPARIVDDRTLVPVRAVSESFNAEVSWDGEARIVTINSSAVSETPAATEAAPSPTSSPTATAEPYTGELPATTLSDTDLEQLAKSKELIRYSFEQSTLMEYAMNSETLYEDIQDQQKITEDVYDTWTRTAASLIISIQTESETEYVFDSVLTDDELLDAYDAILKRVGISAEDMFNGVYISNDTDTDTYAAVIEFKSADSLVQCKYTGIVASKNSPARYFTAENDVLTPDSWFLCEVTPNGRSTIGIFDKTGDNEADAENFVNFIFYLYSDPQTEV